MTSIIVLDVETTGKDRTRDQIVELCVQLGLHEHAESVVWRIRPTVPIHPEAQAVHGISAESLADCPQFGALGAQVSSLLVSADVIVGYNVAFDLDMVQAELERAGLPLIDLAAKQVVDVLRLWHHVEPRTLVAAYEKFCGAALNDAHAASVDVAATGRVLGAMLEQFGLADRQWAELAAIANPFVGREKWIGPSHHLQWDDGYPVFSFGKNKGCRVDGDDHGFLLWVIRQDFPVHVKEICRAAMKQRGEDMTAWIGARFPRPRNQAAA